MLELDIRISKMWKCFAAHRDALRNTNHSLCSRLRFLDKIIEANLWCAGSWNLKHNEYKRLRGVQMKMYLQVVRPRMMRGEFWLDFGDRCGRLFSELKQRYDVGCFDGLVHKAYFRWAGWLARLQQFDPDRITYGILRALNFDVLKSRELECGSQQHGRKAHVFRWEKGLYKYFKISCAWMEAASDRRLWDKRLEKLIQHRLHNR